MSAKNAVQLDAPTINRCKTLIIETAGVFHIAPILITSHSRSKVADEARRQVQSVMLTEMHLRRWQVALLFNRSVRRVRRSVLGV